MNAACRWLQKWEKKANKKNGVPLLLRGVEESGANRWKEHLGEFQVCIFLFFFFVGVSTHTQVTLEAADS